MMLKVEEWPIAKLVPYARNPRINDAAVPKLAGLIREFGFKVPIVVKADGTIIDGHERYKAAQLLGLESVPVTVADEWTEAQVKAFRLAVNKSAEWAQWDNALLSLELGELQDMNFDIAAIDFDVPDLNFGEAEVEEKNLLDQTSECTKPKMIRCPHCGETYEARKDLYVEAP